MQRNDKGKITSYTRQNERMYIAFTFKSSEIGERRRQGQISSANQEKSNTNLEDIREMLNNIWFAIAKVLSGNVQVKIEQHLYKYSNRALKAVLWESSEKLEIKTFNPPSFFFSLCGGKLPGGINKNNSIRVSKCIAAMVTAIDHASLWPMFWWKICSQIVMFLESRTRVRGN